MAKKKDAAAFSTKAHNGKDPTHRASWSKNREGNGFNLRIVMGKDDPDVMSGTVVEVRRKDDSRSAEIVDEVLWCGPSTDDDANEGDMIVLATAKAKPKRTAREMVSDRGDDIPF